MNVRTKEDTSKFFESCNNGKHFLFHCSVILLRFCQLAWEEATGLPSWIMHTTNWRSEALVYGMDQAWVGQKWVKRNKFTWFLNVQLQVSNPTFVKPRLCLIHLSICYYTSVAPPPPNYILMLMKPFSFVWYLIPLLKTGALASTCNLSPRVDDDKTNKKLAYVCPMASIGCNTFPMAASSGFYQSLGPPQLGDACGIIPAHRCGHQHSHQRWPIFCHRFVCCCPGACWGNTEQVGARWQHPVASGVVLDMLHWEMPSVLLRRTALAIKMVNNRGAFVRLHCLLYHNT